MQWRNLSHRPKGITFMSILQIIGGIIAILVALSTMSMFNGLNSFGMQSSFSLMILPMIISFIYIPLGIFFVLVGRGLYKGRGWAWKYTIIVQVVSFVFSLLSVFLMPLLFPSLPPTPLAIESNEHTAHTIGQIIGGLTPSVIFFVITMSYMLRPKTRAYFGKIQIDV